MAENVVIEFAPGPLSPAMAYYQQLGAENIERLSHISAVLGSEIWVMAFPDGIDKSALRHPQVLRVEGEVEHAFFGQGFTPIVDVVEGGQLFRGDRQPGRNAFQNEVPFGSPELRLGTPITSQEFADRGGLSDILSLIQAPGAWEWNRGSGATIVVVDSGVDERAIGRGRQAGGWAHDVLGDPWEDSYGHGTMVAAIAAAVAPEAKIFSMKPKVGPSGGLLGSSVIKAMDVLLGLGLGPIAVNLSWGVYGCVSSDVVCRVIPSRLVSAINQGAVTVWAAGNSRGLCRKDERLLWCLNSMPSSISVAALGPELRPQPYSSPGPGQCSPDHPSVSCPTFGVLPWGSGFIDFGGQGGGTSSCAPQVAGVMAMLLTELPDAPVPKLKAAVQLTANQKLLGQRPGWDRRTGYGLLQAADAIEWLVTH